MGIEDQSIQAYQAIGRPPAAPQLTPQNAYAQKYSAQIGYNPFQQDIQRPQPAELGLSDMRARPDFNVGAPVPRQMDREYNPMYPTNPNRQMTTEARPPWLTQPPRQEDMYKPQLGAYASSLHQIADKIQNAGGGGQLGKFGGGGDFGRPGAGLSGLGQLGGGMQDFIERQRKATMGPSLAEFGGGNQYGGGGSSWMTGNPMLQSMQQQTMEYRPQIQNQSMMGGMVPGSNMQPGGFIAYRGGGDVDSGLASAAKKLAAKGRKGDSILVHMSPEELHGLQAIAKDHGMHLTVNPETGLIEAWSLKKAFKKIGSAVKSVAKVVTAPVKAVASAVKDTIGPVVTKLRDVAQTGLNVATLGATKNLTSKGATENFNKIKDKVGPVFTKLRDVAESAAVMAGNYFVPGSSILTQGLASKGSQKLLNSGVGQVLQMATGNLAGAGGGMAALKGGLSNLMKGGIGNLASNAMSGLKNLGTNAMAGLKSLGNKGLAAVTNFVKNPATALKDLGTKGLNYVKDKVKDLGMDKVTDWVGEKLGGLKEGAGDLIEGAGNAVSDAWDSLTSGQGGEGTEGADAGGTGGADGGGSGGGGGAAPKQNPNDLIKILGSLYAAKHPFEDPREKAGITNLPKPQFQNTQLKQVPNPNYGKPGEPFFISQEFTPAQAADAPTPAAGGGLMSSAYAHGGVTGYAPGGDVGEYKAGGRLLDGPGDGMSDSIPAEIRGKRVQKALLADGEFVIPADVVSGLGNGSTKAGAKVLYGMMDRVRQARTGTTEQGKQINPNKVIPA